MTEFLDFQYPVIGRKADAAQLREILDQPTHIKIVGVVDRGFGAQGGTFGATLMILLEVRVFIVDVQRGDDPVRDAARPTSAVGGILRAKMSCTVSGRPKSIFSRITSSKNSRPCRGRSQT